MHIFLSGKSGSGKSQDLVKHLNGKKLYGFQTEKKDGKVYIFRPFSDPSEWVEAADLEQGKTYLAAFDAFGASLLSNIPAGADVIMDEIGFLEDAATIFLTAVETTIKRKDITIYGVIKTEGSLLSERIKKMEGIRLVDYDKGERLKDVL